MLLSPDASALKCLLLLACCAVYSRLAGVINASEKALHVMSAHMKDGEHACYQLKMLILHEIHLRQIADPSGHLVSPQ